MLKMKQTIANPSGTGTKIKIKAKRFKFEQIKVIKKHFEISIGQL